MLRTRSITLERRPNRRHRWRVVWRRAGDGEELGFAIVVGGAPFGGDPAALLKADESGVNGALVEENFFATDLFDAAGDAVAVLGTEDGEGLEDHKVEGALQ